MKNFRSTIAKVVIFACVSSLHAQSLYIDDHFFVSNNTEVYVNGSISIDADGIVYNKGTIRLTGDLTNTGNFQVGPLGPIAANQGEIILQGDVRQNVQFNGDTVFNITLNNSADISGGEIYIEGDLRFISGSWLLNNNHLGFTPNGNPVDHDANKHIHTTGNGSVSKNYAAAGSFLFPIGTGSAFHPLDLDPKLASLLSVRVRPQILQDPTNLTSSVLPNSVNATWVISSSVSLVNADIGLQYPLYSENTGFNRNAARLLSWEDNVSLNYFSQAASTTGTDPYTSGLSSNFNINTGNDYFLGLGGDQTGIYVLAKVFLEGPFDPNLLSMSTALSAGGQNSILATHALQQPYGNGNWWNYQGTEQVAQTFFDNHPNIVDWVLIELRNHSNNTDIVARRAGFLRSDGSIIDLDGLPGLNFPQTPPNEYFISVRHRNHLGAMTLAPVLLDQTRSTLDVDYSIPSTTFYGNSSVAEVAPGIFALHMGNAHINSILNFTGSDNDKAAVGITVNSSVTPSNSVPGYHLADIDLNGTATFTGSNNDKSKLGLKLNTSISVSTTASEQLP